MDDDLLISRREILAILFRRGIGVISILVGSIAAAAFAVFYLISPSYESDAVIIINFSYLTEPLRDGPPETGFEKLASFHTQRDILQSERMAAETVRRMGLGKTRVIGRIERIEIAIHEIRVWVGNLAGITRWQKPWNPEAAAIGAVHRWVKTFALPDSNAMKITFRSKDPEEAAAVLATLLDIHRDYFYEVVRRKASGAVAFLEHGFANAQEALTQAEQALIRFRQSDRLEVDTLAGGRSDREAAPSIVGATDSTKVQEELKLYVLKLEEELRVTNLIRDIERRQQVTADLRARIRRYLRALDSVPARELELVRLKRQFDIAQDNYRLLQRNLAQARMVASAQTNKINLIELFQAPAPDDRVRFPQKRLILILAGMLGVVLALTYAFVIDYLDHALRSSNDVRRYLKTRLIASLSKIR